ncbi:hypothetical protein BpJC7_15280 [Weizmannia acidilactici]|uniref:Uncharacterized protein n=1 Tax=Weizmannia acidilactici TaxID=2607726 RepID=A0A5J4JHR6_9BACI|nr:hypothetical protein BpJC4_10250 [Weizmannia acidilactici]GER70225.1 hypothetical protein BpJC7_15280 [Weizmannia acidilactici]GER74574.1 hypothetical protein BpPP18_26410 [Weizmannia acidilactici]
MDAGNTAQFTKQIFHDVPCDAAALKIAVYDDIVNGSIKNAV